MSKSKTRETRIPPPRPASKVKRRHSPGGVITCANSHLVSRRRFNNALRFKQTPTCNECGSKVLYQTGEYEIRGAGDSKRLIWKKAKSKSRSAKTRRTR